MKNVINEAEKHFDKVEAYRLAGTSVEVEFEFGRLKKIDSSENFGLALRGVKDGRVAFSTTTKPDDIEGVIRAGLDVVEFSPRSTFDFSGGDSDLPKEPVLFSERTARVSVKEMVETGREIVEKIRNYDENIQPFAGFGTSTTEVEMAASAGFEGSYRRTSAGFACGGKLVEGKNMLFVFESRSAIEYDFDFAAVVGKVLEDFEVARKNVGFSGGDVPVILTPHAVSDLLLPMLACCNGKAVAKGISPWKDRLGEKMFDERISVYDDGLLANAVGTAYFDDEGVAAQKTPLIEKGVLQNYVLDLESAAALGRTSTGNGIRAKRFGSSKDSSSPPAPSVTNVVMEGGERGIDEMMSEMGDGLLIDRLMGTMMGNLYGGVVGGNVLLGYKVEGGKRVGRIKDAMFSVNAFEVLRDGLAGLSREREMLGTFLLPYVWLKSASISTKQ